MSSHPFYNSVRFRFGMLFGLVFLFFLTGIVALLYRGASESLTSAFRSRLETEADLVLQKTEIDPLVIPLPQKRQHYRLIYRRTEETDTLFDNLPQDLRTGWGVRTASTGPETGGRIEIVYALPDDELRAATRGMRRLLFLYLPLAFLLSLVIGYLLSGFLLRPVRSIIARANATDLQQQIRLLPDAPVQDEFHELTVALNRMLARIDAQSRERNAFFASASHELRTPLSNMLTQLQVSEQSNTVGKNEEVFASQIAEVRRLSRVVDDFLLMSQLGASAVIPAFGRMDLLEACLETIERERAASQIKIDLHPVDASWTVSADQRLVQLILRNLIGNAVKYGRPDRPVSILFREREGDLSLRIVNETSERIADVSKLREEFIRSASRPDGFGLGLWIAGQLCRLNRIRMDIRFEAPQFEVELQFDLSV